jgi:hypothetical protein
MSRQRFVFQIEAENQFREKAYSLAYSDSPRLTAILEHMRSVIPTLNTDGIRLNIQPERVHEADLRSSIYSALCRDRHLLAETNDVLIFGAACQAYLDNIIFPGI